MKIMYGSHGLYSIAQHIQLYSQISERSGGKSTFERQRDDAHLTGVQHVAGVLTVISLEIDMCTKVAKNITNAILDILD